MKLIIQIPCYNEEENLPETLRNLPVEIPGVDQIEVMVVDDGSNDNTIKVAKDFGVDHIVKLGSNRGLATAFRRGVEYALAQGADIVVNTDADNQYSGSDIPKLVKPILNHEADLVVGCRPISKHTEFKPTKKFLQLMGSWTLRRISKTSVRDAASGFRAFSRETCQRVFIHSQFSYCMETLIQAGNSGIRVASVDVRVNPKTRESRLFTNMTQYIFRSGSTMLFMFILYRPGAFFISTGSIFIGIALYIGLRFLYLMYIIPQGTTKHSYLQSLILLSVCSMIGVLLYALAIIGEIMRAQRKVSEETLFLMRSKK